jgi:hypothetical protein
VPAVYIPVSWMTSETKDTVMLDLEVVVCGGGNGSGFCPVMGGVERPGNQ